jgi:hypothetical protein
MTCFIARLLLLCVVISCVHQCVTAGYTPCSDPASCGSRSCCTAANVNGVNVDYCCLGAGNFLDYDTKQCANSVQCGEWINELAAAA